MNLKQGDIIDLIAPSSPPKNNQWKKGLKILQNWGLKPRFPEGALSPWLWHANSDEKRSYFLNQAFSNKDSSTVWMIRGGYGLQKLMPSFVKKYSKKQQKFFIGYSDGTALHLYLNSQNQKTLHAPLVCELLDLSQTELTNLKNILFGIKKEFVFNNLTSLNPFPKKTLNAPIMGGNLSLLSGSVGTAWFPSFKSHFLFIEDVNEEDYKIDRFLHHLLYSGSLKNVKAILFGNFYPLNKTSLRRSRFLKSFSKICPIPLIFRLSCGHCSPHHPLPFKIPAQLLIQGHKARLKITLN